MGATPGWPALLPLAGFALTLALGIFAWSRRGNAALQRSFGALNVAVALWNLDVLLLFAAPDGETAGRLDRLFQAPIIALPLLALVFFHVFLGRRLAAPLPALFALWAAVLVCASAGPHYLTGWRRFWFGWYGTPGALYPLLVAYVVAYLGVSTALLAREARATRDAQRRSQARWLLSANLLLGLSSLTNFLPLWGVPFLPLGNVASVAYVCLMGVAIFRHGLLDAQVLFRAGMLYSALTFLLTAVYFGLVLGLQRWMQDEVFAGSLLLPMLPALAVGFAVGPLKASLQERLDRTFFRSRAETRARVEAFSAVLRRLEREEEVWAAAWEEGWRHAHPESGVVLRRADGAFDAVAGPGAPATDAEAAGALFEGLERPCRLAGEGPHEVAVPVRGRDGLLGGCLLGPKESGELWKRADLTYLGAIAGQAALAVEQARLRRRVEREAQLAALGRMAAVVSHELKNHLNIIRGGVGVLRRQLDGQPGAPVLRVVEDQVDRGDRFLHDVLFACREQTPHLVAIDLALCLREFAESWNRAGASLELRAPVEGLWVRGDAFQLRRVFENLALNAAEAAGDGGRITVTAEARAGVCVAVADEGPGLDPGMVPVLFEPFRTTKRGGSGLGLSIAKGVVERHGGRIGAANRPGGGAVFRIWLPALDAPPPGILLQSRAAGAAGGRRSAGEERGHE